MHDHRHTGKTSEFRGVQVLRGVAALAVVAGHSNDFLAERGGVPPALHWIHGPAGVDIFFVISGFVMMMTSPRLLRQPHPSRLFLWRRWIRIVPLYWLLTAVRLTLVHLWPSLTEHELPSLWNSVASFLFIPAVAYGGVIRPVIPAGWTLSFEMMFYLIFAAALLGGERRLLLWVTAAIVALACVGTSAHPSWPVWTTLADPIVLEFLAGIWIAQALGRRCRAPAWALASALVLGVAGLALITPGTGRADRALLWGVFATLIVWSTVGLETWLASRLPRWSLALGDASYSIYLTQMFVFPPVQLIVTHLSPTLIELHRLRAGILMIALNLTCATILGLLTHRWVEKPITERLRRTAGVARPQAVTP